MIKVVSFDLDGTLINQEFTDIFWNKAIPKLYSIKFNIPYEDAVNYILNEYNKVGPDDIKWYIPEYWLKKFKLNVNFEYIANMIKNELKIYPDVKETLEFLSKKFVLIISSSNTKNFLKFKLRPIENYFKLIISSIDDFKMAKKNREFYERLCKKLNLEPNEIVHVGNDCICDYEEPRKVGITAFLIDREGKFDKNDFIIRSLNELTKKF